MGDMGSDDGAAYLIGSALARPKMPTVPSFALANSTLCVNDGISHHPL